MEERDERTPDNLSPYDNSEIYCPFCGDTGYDLPGLKYHFTYCEEYAKTEFLR